MGNRMGGGTLTTNNILGQEISASFTSLVNAGRNKNQGGGVSISGNSAFRKNTGQSN